MVLNGSTGFLLAVLKPSFLDYESPHLATLDSSAKLSPNALKAAGSQPMSCARALRVARALFQTSAVSQFWRNSSSNSAAATGKTTSVRCFIDKCFEVCLLFDSF